MDLLKAFDCILHNLPFGKLYVYGLSEDAVTFVYSYLKCRKQGAKINDTERFIQILLYCVPQGSIVDPILFKFFIKYYFVH